MVNRRDEDVLHVNPIKHQINISAFVPGPSRINDVWVKSDGQIVTELEAGKKFKVYVDFDAANIEGGTWSTCLTLTDASGQIRNWHKSNASSNGQVIDEMGENTMPDSDISLRVKLWGHDDVNPQPPYPAMELW